MAKTDLTVAQKNELIALGAKMSDIRAEASDGVTFEQMVELFTTARDAAVQEKQGDADRQAKATKRAMRPENEHANPVSVFHPKGYNSRTLPICPLFWAGMDVRGDVDSDEEVERMNAVPAGVYTCTKADGSQTKVTVEVQTDVKGRPTEKKFSFSTAGLNMRNHGSRISYLKEMQEQAAQGTQEPVTRPTSLVTLSA